LNADKISLVVTHWVFVNTTTLSYIFLTNNQLRSDLAIFFLFSVALFNFSLKSIKLFSISLTSEAGAVDFLISNSNIKLSSSFGYSLYSLSNVAAEL